MSSKCVDKDCKVAKIEGFSSWNYLNLPLSKIFSDLNSHLHLPSIVIVNFAQIVQKSSNKILNVQMIEVLTEPRAPALMSGVEWDVCWGHLNFSSKWISGRIMYEGKL